MMRIAKTIAFLALIQLVFLLLAAFPAGAEDETVVFQGVLGKDLVVKGDTIVASLDSGDIVALNAKTGQRIWTVTTEPNVSIAASKQMVYAVGLRSVYAIDLKEGRMVWRQPVAEGYSNEPLSPEASGNERSVFIPIGGSSLTAMDARTGKRLWRANIAVSSSPLYANGRVYVGTDGGQLIALSAESGKTIWKSDIVDRVTGKPAISNGQIYFADSSGKVYGVNLENGSILWKSFLGEQVTAPLLKTDGEVIALSDNGNAFSVDDHTGAIQWEYKAQGLTVGSAAMWNGLLVFSSTSQVNCVDLQSGRPLGKVDLAEKPATSPAYAGGAWFIGTIDTSNDKPKSKIVRLSESELYGNSAEPGREPAIAVDHDRTMSRLSEIAGPLAAEGLAENSEPGSERSTLSWPGALLISSADIAAKAVKGEGLKPPVSTLLERLSLRFPTLLIAAGPQNAFAVSVIILAVLSSLSFGSPIGAFILRSDRSAALRAAKPSIISVWKRAAGRYRVIFLAFLFLWGYSLLGLFFAAILPRQVWAFFAGIALLTTLAIFIAVFLRSLGLCAMGENSDFSGCLKAVKRSGRNLSRLAFLYILTTALGMLSYALFALSFRSMNFILLLLAAAIAIIILGFSFADAFVVLGEKTALEAMLDSLRLAASQKALFSGYATSLAILILASIALPQPLNPFDPLAIIALFIISAGMVFTLSLQYEIFTST